MKQEKLLEALEKIEEELIEEAAPGNKPPKKKEKSMVWMKWGTMVACAVVIVGISVPLYHYIGGKTEESQLEVSKDTTISHEMEREDNDNTTTDTGFPNWGLTLSVKDVTASGLTLVCAQSGGEPTGELQTGSDYHLIVLKDGTWQDVPTIIEEYGWNAIAYIVEKDDSTEFEIKWEWLYGKLPAGTYRLTKGFTDFRKSGEYDNFTYWTEFEIK